MAEAFEGGFNQQNGQSGQYAQGGMMSKPAAGLMAYEMGLFDSDLLPFAMMAGMNGQNQQQRPHLLEKTLTNPLSTATGAGVQPRPQSGMNPMLGALALDGDMKDFALMKMV